jgi:hypothetical protein
LICGKYRRVSDWSEFEKGDTIKVFCAVQSIYKKMSLNIIYNWVVKTISQQNYCGAGFAYGN